MQEKSPDSPDRDSAFPKSFRWRRQRDSRKSFPKKSFCQIRKSRSSVLCEKETGTANTRQSTFRSPPVQTWKIFLVFKLNFGNFSDCRTWLFFEPDYSKPKLSGEQSCGGAKIVINEYSGRNRCIDLFRVRSTRKGSETVGWPCLVQWLSGFTPERPWKRAENVDKTCPVRKVRLNFRKSLKDVHCAKRRQNMIHASHTSAKDGRKVLKFSVLRSN